MTEMSIGEYFMVGSAVMARLVNFADTGQGAPMLQPDLYFSSTKIDPRSSRRSSPSRHVTSTSYVTNWRPRKCSTVRRPMGR
jgi:hypothetical protein